MFFNYVAIATLAVLTMAGAASAQTNSNQINADSSVPAKEGGWRGSKIPGVNVYNDANEKIGDINDVIFDRSGKITNVIVAVGGFLGLGEHYVGIAYDKLKWVDQPVTATTTSTTSAPEKAPATTSAPDSTTRTTTDGPTATTTTTTTTRASDRWYPDHAIYNATKDELKALPEFKY